MPYGSIKVDNIIYTKGGSDTTITVSGIVDSLSGSISVTGAISGASVTATTGIFTTLSGTTTTGTTANFVSGVFTTQISGATITGNTGQFTSGVFTSISGTTVNITSGVFASGTEAAPSVSVGTTNNGLYSPGTNQVAISTSGTGRVFVNSSLGIVDFLPSSNRHIVLTSLADYANNGIVAVNNSGSEIDLGIGGANVRLFADATERLRVTATGDVNIKGAGTAGSTQAVSFSGSAPVDSLVVNASGNVVLNGVLSCKKTGTQYAVFGVTGTILGDATTDTGVFADGASSAINLYTGGSTTAKATLDASGNLGLGLTPSGTRKLQVQSTGIQLGLTYPSVATWEFRVDSSGNLNFDKDTSSKMTLDASGNLGIGETSPAHKLSLKTTASTYIKLAADFGDGYIGMETADDTMRIVTGQTTPIVLFTNNQERARIDSSGRLLVGATSARNAAGGAQSTRSPLYYIEGAGANAYSVFTGVIGRADAVGPAIVLAKTRSNDTGAVTVVQNDDALGSIWFAGADGTDLNSSGASITAEVDGTPGVDDIPGRLVFSTTADGAASPTERMRISSGGAVTISGPSLTTAAVTGHGTIEVQAQNAASQNAYFYLTCPGSNQGAIWYERATSRLYVYSQSGGVYLGSTATSWTANSDERLKDIIEPIENASEKVASLRAVIGKYKSDEEGTRRSFLIAQDVQAVLPEAVSTDDPNALGVAYTDVIPLLVAAIKELKVETDVLKAKVAALEAA